MLIQNSDLQDPDFNSGFTVKTYSSQKNIREESWRHESIIIKPNSYDKSFKKIIIEEDSNSEIRMIGEFVMVLDK